MKKVNFLSDLIRELSYFSLQEKKALFYLISLTLIIIATPYIFQSFDSNSHKFEELNFVIESSPNKEQRFPFNPNTVSKDSLLLLGFSDRQAQTLINYRNKSKGFYKKDDLKKLFFMTDTLYEQLSDYIVLPERKSTITHKKYSTKVERNKKSEIVMVKEKININTADTTILKTLPGIGSYFAKKMIAYRERLGGYHAAEQLLEIYNFGEERLEKIRHLIYINPDEIKTINFATDTIVDILGRHPYLGFKIVRAALKMQRYSKTKITVEELVSQKIISAEQGEKLKPYLAD